MTCLSPRPLGSFVGSTSLKFKCSSVGKSIRVTADAPLASGSRYYLAPSHSPPDTMAIGWALSDASALAAHFFGKCECKTPSSFF